ncbi:MAG: hypothetical protein HY920_09115 [Elusimicrobia bacterium]|nr:hypothetical protein [Elusimicrobiota bacterium]
MRSTLYFKGLFILLSIVLLTGCTGVNGTLTIYNKTGHNGLYVSASKSHVYLDDNKSIEVDVYNGESVTVRATKEERNASGAVTWRYRYEGQVYCSWDPQDWFLDANSSRSFNLTPQINQYK